MIASLSGTLEYREADLAVISVHGVGFEVRLSASALDRLGAPGSPVFVHTYLHLRENEIALFGFSSHDERALCLQLMSVSGIGPRLALNLLRGTSPEALRLAIANGDVATLSRLPGIGKKMAERLVVELKGKINLANIDLGVAVAGQGDAEVMAALTGLGYSTAEAQAAIRHLPKEAIALEDRIMAALRYFAERG
ncbi:MAG: Holliday junction branch migration protein RuvA [Chloroflexi bacterium]|nr:Holliday junction branch migration protein RuvA [Chloroflexota bacterium]